MAFVPNNMSGSLFRNDNKTNDSQPGYRGSCMIDGKEYWVSAWVKETRDGKKYFSMAYTLKDEQPKPVTPATNFEDFSDDIPF